MKYFPRTQRIYTCDGAAYCGTHSSRVLLGSDAV